MRLRLTTAVSLVLAVLISLFGMQSMASGAPLAPAPREVALTEADNGRLLELEQSQLLAIRLDCNPSTGYRWDVQQMDRGILRQVGEAEFVAQSGLLGAPATQTLRFAGIAQGWTGLQLVYQRPWESDVPPARTFSVQVQSKGLFVGVDNSESEPTGAAMPSGQVSTGAALPASFDWCAQGGCTSVKNQGSCGSCWAFSTVGSFESAIKLQDAVERNLSEQYLVSCNESGWDCDGGWFAHDYHEWRIPQGESAPGARYELDFPYTAINARCNPPHPAHEKLDDWFYVTNSYSVPSVDLIKQAIYDHGPVSASVCVNSAFQSYRNGVFTGPGCWDINHGIVLVGWDDSRGAWLLRNSWGPGWGESGYMWIQYGVSRVGYAANYVLYGGQNQPPNNGRITPNSGAAPAGQIVCFTTTWSDPNGQDDLKACRLHIGCVAAPKSLIGNAVLVYQAQTNKIMIRNNAGTRWWGGKPVGSDNVVQNAQAKVYCNLTTVSRSGNTITVNWAVEFKPAFQGATKMYLKARDVAGLTSNLEQKGTWTVQ